MKSKEYTSLIITGVLSISLVVLNGCVPNEKKDMRNAELSTRGKYLSELGGCVDCHSPKTFTDGVRSVDYTRLFSGHPEEEGIPAVCLDDIESGAIIANKHFTAHVGLWGVTFATNLTPDEETGIGSWTVDQFIDAIRTGQRLPMPSFCMEQLSDEELSDIYAYIMTMPAIKNKVPPAMSLGELKEYLDR